MSLSPILWKKWELIDPGTCGCRLFSDYPSLKLTAFANENGWLEYFLVSFWDGLFSGASCYFQGGYLVICRVSSGCIPCNWGDGFVRLNEVNVLMVTCQPTPPLTFGLLTIGFP